MTICISAIAKENGRDVIVLATDHMLTGPTGQFEAAIVKYRVLNQNTVGMLAGRALLTDDVFCLPPIPEEKTQTALTTKRGYSLEEIRNFVYQNFLKKRKEVIQQEILNQFGIGPEFVVDSLQKQIPNPFVGSILESIAKFELKSSVLVSGFRNSKAEIFEINEIRSQSFASVGFHAIGSGAVQAINTLLFQRHSKDEKLSVALYNVFKAKRNSEVGGGVGHETDVLVLRSSGVTTLPKTTTDALDEIYQTELNFGKNKASETKLGTLHPLIK